MSLLILIICLSAVGGFIAWHGLTIESGPIKLEFFPLKRFFHNKGEQNRREAKEEELKRNSNHL